MIQAGGKGPLLLREQIRFHYAGGVAEIHPVLRSRPFLMKEPQFQIVRLRRVAERLCRFRTREGWIFRGGRTEQHRRRHPFVLHERRDTHL